MFKEADAKSIYYTQFHQESTAFGSAGDKCLKKKQ